MFALRTVGVPDALPMYSHLVAPILCVFSKTEEFEMRSLGLKVVCFSFLQKTTFS